MRSHATRPAPAIAGALLLGSFAPAAALADNIVAASRQVSVFYLPDDPVPGQVVAASRLVSAWNNPCPVDYDLNGVVQPADIALFVNTWFQSLESGSTSGDFDATNLVEPSDVSVFINMWFQSLSIGHCP